MGTYVVGSGGDGDSSDGDGVGMGFVFTWTGGDGVQFLSPCRPLLYCTRVPLKCEYFGTSYTSCTSCTLKYDSFGDIVYGVCTVVFVFCVVHNSAEASVEEL